MINNTFCNKEKVLHVVNASCKSTLFSLKPLSKMLFASCILVGVSTPINAETEKNAKEPPKEAVNKKTWSDKKIHLGQVTITPGGFFAGEGVWRSRNIMTDMGSNFAAIPTLNLPQAYMKEFRLSARQSRLSALAEGNIDPQTLLSGYVETDFLGNGSGNSNESNSFDLRIRQFYASVDWTQPGWHLLAGQAWTLMTLNNDGITPRHEVLPPTIDAQYLVGFIWKRQPQVRVTKNFGQRFWAAVSVENAQTLFGGTPACIPAPVGVGPAFNGISNIFCNAPGTQFLPVANFFSFNQVPDVVGKVAYQDTLNNHKVHLEVFGIYRDFYDRVYYTDGTKTSINTTGYGAGVGTFIEIIPKKLDIQGSALLGSGIGSYSSGVLPDVTFAQNGSLKPIDEFTIMAGITAHITRALDIYVFGGKEQQKATYFYSPPPTNNFFGLGIPDANNSGCSTEGGVCAGNTKELWQITTGLWDKIYEGAYGQFRAGLQYSYTKKILFPGTGAHEGGIPVGKAVGGQTNDNMVFFSLRYFPFENSAATPASMK